MNVDEIWELLSKASAELTGTIPHHGKQEVVWKRSGFQVWGKLRTLKPFRSGDHRIKSGQPNVVLTFEVDPQPSDTDPTKPSTENSSAMV